MSTEERAPARAVPGRWWKPAAFLAIIMVVIVLARVLGLGQKLEAVRDWIGGLGPWGSLVFIAVYIAATVAMVPGSALTVGAGALFGSFWGVVYVSIASTVGASLCFLTARFVARRSVEGWLSTNESFQRLDALVRERGWLVVAVTRLVPLFPFNLLNYGFGLTGVRFVTYVACSWVCMLPGTVLYVVGTDAVLSAIRMGRVPWTLVGVVAVAVVLLALVARRAAHVLHDAGEDEGESAEGEPHE